MAAINFAYGRKTLSLAIPDKNILNEIGGASDPQDSTDDHVLLRALGDLNPDLILNKRVTVLCDDYTRPTPRAEIFAALFPKLFTANAVDFLITTGTHNPNTPGNAEILKAAENSAKSAGLRSFEMFIHDVNGSNFSAAGQTRHGTQVRYNQILDRGEIFIVISDMKPHYFAGYSNPIKHFLPGCCDFRATENNHSMALDTRSSFGRHPLHNDEKRRDNPLAADQLEAMKLIVGDRPVLALHLITNNGRISNAVFGEIFKTLPVMFDRVDRYFGEMVAPADIAIVSPGGFPDDESLYTSQRALELTAAGVKTDGRVLFLSACENGIGTARAKQNFYDRLTQPLEDVLKTIEEDYVLYAHKAYKFAVMIQNLQTLAVKSELTPEILTAAHLTATDNPQQTLNNWLAETPDATINIFHHANKLAIYQREN